jgi:hypothetical protein
MEHQFTHQIKTILESHFGIMFSEIYEKSPLLQYLNIKTRSATRGSKSRGSFANLYAVYVLVEDYLSHHFDQTETYAHYEGAKYTTLFTRQRTLPFGSKLQNHALNHRLNEEFKKYFPQATFVPILRDVETGRYWFNENLLKVTVAGRTFNIAQAIIDIIDLYVKTKQRAFESFIETCERLKSITVENRATAEQFILSLLAPQVDARIFEIVSYAILKYYYHDQVVYFGFTLDNLQQENLTLYKTGRTNANDGGIDFVMRPIGRFFQVTETLDVRKYFLDIDKIEKFPISFVIKTEEPIEALKAHLQQGAKDFYSVETIVHKYMRSVEELINLPTLRNHFNAIVAAGHLSLLLEEIIKQSRIEFNYPED